MTAVDHILLTRFNLPSEGVESLIRARDNWLRDRVALFERYTISSVRAQTVTSFHWFVYFDPESPQWLIDWTKSFVDEGLFVPLLRETVSAADIVADAERLQLRSQPDLMTTNLDNDDGLAVDFVERLQQVVGSDHRVAIYLTRGLIFSPKGLYLRRDRRNAFCSVRESWQHPVSCWADWHNLLPKSMPVRYLVGPPAWLQVVHGTNVSNRIRGRLVKPDVYRHLFADEILGAARPRTVRLLADRIAGHPFRIARDGARAAAKHAIMAVAGKDGIDRLKALIASGRDRTLKVAP